VLPGDDGTARFDVPRLGVGVEDADDEELAEPGEEFLRAIGLSGISWKNWFVKSGDHLR
jgi:hypothetical protein